MWAHDFTVNFVLFTVRAFLGERESENSRVIVIVAIVKIEKETEILKLVSHREVNMGHWDMLSWDQGTWEHDYDFSFS